MLEYFYQMKIRWAAGIFLSVDDYLTEKGYVRQERKQFWREMVGSKQARKRAFKKLRGK